jgi:hypothetical protein
MTANRLSKKVKLKRMRVSKAMYRFARSALLKVLIPLDVAHDSGMISPTVPI